MDDSLQNLSTIPAGHFSESNSEASIEADIRDLEEPEVVEGEVEVEDDLVVRADRLPIEERRHNFPHLRDLRSKIHRFLEEPKTAIDLLVQYKVIVLPLCSSNGVCVATNRWGWRNYLGLKMVG